MGYRFIFNRICNPRIGSTLFQLCHVRVITKSQKKTESEFCPPEHRQHTLFVLNQKLICYFFNRICNARIGRTEFRLCHVYVITDFQKNHEPGSCFIFNRICNSRIGRTLFQLCHAYVITKSQKKTESKFCPPEHRQHTLFVLNQKPGCFIFNRICNPRIGRTLFQLCHAYVITKSQKMTESEFCPPEHR